MLRHSKGLAIMTVVKAGLIFSAKGGQGVVVARTGRGWSGPSFIATGGAGWGLQIGAQVTDFVIVLNNDSAVKAFARGGNVTHRRGCQRRCRPGRPHCIGRRHTYGCRLHLQQEQGSLCRRVPGGRSNRNATEFEFPLLRAACQSR